LNDFHGFDADGANSLQSINYLLFIVRKFVRVEQFGDRGVFGFLFFVLIEDPFKGRTITEFVFPSDRLGTKQSSIAWLEDADYDGQSLSMLQKIAFALNQRVEIRLLAIEPEKTLAQ